MSFYVLFSRPIGGSSCYNQCFLQLVQNEVKSFKSINFHKRHFMSSLVKRKSNRKLGKSNTEAEVQKELNSLKTEPFSVQLLFKPFLFTVAFSAASLAGSAVWQYENVRKKAISFINKSWLTDKWNFHGLKRHSWRKEMNNVWNELTEGQKLFVPICFLNVVIFMAWRIPRFQPTMIKYFCSTPFSKAVCWPMVLCTFSHYNVFHLATNMYVLHSFSTGAVDVLGKEQFLGLFLAGGVISSFFSYLYKALCRNQTLSMGASGAVMAILAYTCAKYPDSKLAIVFIPGFVFSAGTGIKCLMGFDTLGVLCRWKFFDHAAHLGGAFTGIAWCYWGNAYIWQKREFLLDWWHEIRTTSK